MTQMAMDKVRDIPDISFKDKADKQTLASALEMLSRDEPLPDVPETRVMVSKMFIWMYGDALKELARR